MGRFAIFHVVGLLSVLACGFPGMSADADTGRSAFEKRCGGCHSADRVLEGPRLRGVFGRPAGKAPGYPYSDALKSAQFSWDKATLDKWLTDPESVAPGTDMAFRLNRQDERAEIIEYLRQLR